MAEIIGKKVEVNGKVLHEGIVIGIDPVFTDTIWVGVTKTKVKGVALKPGRKYISKFYARRNQLRVVA